jgi:hypothetical protein
MSNKHKEWMIRDDDIATCLLCGGVSHFKFMYNWMPSFGNKSKNFTYWYWWTRWKKAHEKCGRKI